MKADYKNWMPKGMVASFIGGTAGALAIVSAVRIMMPKGPAKSVVTVGARSTHLSTSLYARIMPEQKA